jgi:hypothetical protein
MKISRILFLGIALIASTVSQANAWPDPINWPQAPKFPPDCGAHKHWNGAFCSDDGGPSSCPPGQHPSGVAGTCIGDITLPSVNQQDYCVHLGISSQCVNCSADDNEIGKATCAVKNGGKSLHVDRGKCTVSNGNSEDDCHLIH